MSWGKVDVSQRRMEFVIRAATGKESIRGLCREFEVSPQTGYKWLNRYRRADSLKAVVELSRKPQQCPRKTVAELEGRVVEQRQLRPDWGARKLQKQLEKDGIQLNQRTIHRILIRHGLVPERERRRPATQRFERERPNELWQMDYKGLPHPLAQSLMPLTILDDHSRYLVAVQALPNTAGEPLLRVLSQVMEKNGVPDAMLVDHGTPWWSATAPWGLTKVSVWLMKQNIEIIHSGVRHPQTQGKVESAHRAMQRQMRLRGWPGDHEWTEWLHSFAEEWNHVRPHEALGYRTPAQCWTPSRRRFQPHPAAFDYTAGCICKVRTHGQIDFQGRSFTGLAALAGEAVALQHVDADRWIVRYRNTIIRELDVSTGRSTPLGFHPYTEFWEL